MLWRKLALIAGMLLAACSGKEFGTFQGVDPVFVEVDHRTYKVMVKGSMVRAASWEFGFEWAPDMIEERARLRRAVTEVTGCRLVPESIFYEDPTIAFNAEVVCE